MIEKNDLIKSVSRVFAEAIKEKKTYTIPSYQRGYKWNRDDVFKLLYDLKNFEPNHASNSQSFYCLQNITIVPLSDGTGWNVVDGQQRLTTLYILLSYLHKFNDDQSLSFFSSPSCLSYNVRTDTGTFLEKWIFTGKVWGDKEIVPNSAKRKDQWYILDVAKGIKDWFKIEGNSLLISTITENLKLIVNELASTTVSEEEIFAGLNGGKVDLDGADLVRAVLITRSAKEKYNGELADKVKEFRMRIAMELDELNLWWAQKEQISFFQQFLPSNRLKTSIFKHNSYPIGLLYKLYFLIHSEENEEFGIEFFENGRNFNGKTGDDHWELYESLMLLHKTLQKWFSDSILYHWIGFLIFRFKERTIDLNEITESDDGSPQKVTVNFKSIWKLWNDAKTKDEFLANIISWIQKLLTNSERDIIDNIKNVNQQWYGKDPDGITNALVLMDVLICTGLYRDQWNSLIDKRPAIISDMKPGKNRLPASYFTKYNENFEHIRSCAPNPEEGKEERNKEKWIQHIRNIYAEQDSSTEILLKNALLEILENYPEDYLDDATINKLNKEMNKFGQHSIGNMALLDEHVNKSYGNDNFQRKIQRIFSEFMKNKWFIRPYTMMVFEHKIKDNDKAWRWTQLNITDNATNIANNIETFLNLKL